MTNIKNVKGHLAQQEAFSVTESNDKSRAEMPASGRVDMGTVGEVPASKCEWTGVTAQCRSTYTKSWVQFPVSPKQQQ